MKRTLLTIALLLLGTAYLTQHAEAKIWRVNNNSNYNGSTLYGDNFGGSADYPVFKQINEAVAYGVVSNGDTLHVEGSNIIYDEATITKRLVIIGTGYFLTDNPKTSGTPLDSRIRRITLNTGSENSQIISLNVVEYQSSSDGIIYVNVNGITIKRCRILRGIKFTTKLLDVTILQNFFSSQEPTNALYTNSSSSFVPPAEIIFNNNICQKTLVWSNSDTKEQWLILQCNNNVFDGPDNLNTPNLDFATSEFRNNILMPNNAIAKINNGSNQNVAYCIGTLPTQFGINNNNLVIPAINSLFVSSTVSPDGVYQIAPGTKASNSGSDGTDRGAFGGLAPKSYTLSGLAPVPTVYEVTTTGVASGGSTLPVMIKARIIK